MGASAWSGSEYGSPSPAYGRQARVPVQGGVCRGAPRGEGLCHLRMLSSPEEIVVKLAVDTGTVSTFSLAGLVNLGLLGMA